MIVGVHHALAAVAAAFLLVVAITWCVADAAVLAAIQSADNVRPTYERPADAAQGGPWIKCGNRPRRFITDLLLKHREDLAVFAADADASVAELG